MRLCDLAPAHIRAISPYQPGKPISELAREMGLAEESIVKLASNENPLGVGEKTRAAMYAALADIGTRIPNIRARVETLSGGQRQAIELCRFVHFGGRLVLLDEPFAALGVAQTRRGLELIETVKRRGVAVIVITHNVLHAFQVADRMVVMRQGRVVGERLRAETSHDEIVGLITGG